MSTMSEIEKDEAVEINFVEVEKQCENWRQKGYKVMVVYQPITSGYIHTDFYKSMLSCLGGAVWNYMADKHKLIIMPYVSPHFPIDANRNMAVLDARERYKADYIMFMDTDQTFPPMTIPQLYESMLTKEKEVGLNIMAGMYFAKKNPWGGVFGRYSPWDEKTLKFKKEFNDLGLIHKGEQLLWWKSIDFWDKNQVFQVDVIGAGCMMMPLRLFDALKMPFFKYLPDFQKVGKMASEDMWFCACLKRAEIPVFIDSRVSCGHLSSMQIDEGLFSNQRDAFYRNVPLEKGKETYAKMIDVRSENSKTKWLAQLETPAMEDEHARN